MFPLAPALAALATLAAPPPAATAEALAARTIVVGGDRDYPPYEFLDREGRPAGYNVDLTRAIAEVMGMRVEVRLGGWEEMRSALRDGRVDVLQGMSVSEDRERQVDFTPPHTIVHHAIFARKGTARVPSLEGLRGHRVVLHRGGIMDDLLTKAGMGGDLLRTATPADALRLLASGQGEYAVVAILPGTYITRQLGLTNVEAVATNVAAHQYAYAVREGEEELRTRLSEGLAILKQTGRHQEIYERWLGILEQPAVDWRTFLKYGAVVFVPLVLGLLGALAWTRSLHREVAQRTASLAREAAERQRAMEQLQLQQQLVQADKMAALGVLVSGVAHEINNPNGFLLLNLPTLKGIYLDALDILDEHRRSAGEFSLGGIDYATLREELPRMLDEMQGGARRIKRIVEDLKDFARREDAPQFQDVDLNTVVQAAVRLVEPSIRKATRRFQATYAPDLPAVRGNAQRIEQVVVNLVMNACEALGDPERAVSVATGADRGREKVWLRVTDEGEGIAPEHLNRLTDPFFTTKRASGGTGLGLSVSAGIVKEHGGTLDFSSRPGSGTTVSMVLPAAGRTGGAP